MKLSRTKIDLFVACPRCFFLDIKRGIKRPPGFPFSLNNAVDALLKREFDSHRKNGTAHPLQLQFGIDAIPANHPQIDKWRDSLRGGVSFHLPEYDCTLYGGIDDLWIGTDGQYYVVDYKATAKEHAVTAMPDWANAYKRQVEFYQWLLRKNNLPVSDTAYFVYSTGNTKHHDFNNTLHFETNVIPYQGNAGWVDETITEMFETLQLNEIPTHTENCDYCKYSKAMKDL